MPKSFVALRIVETSFNPRIKIVHTWNAMFGCNLNASVWAQSISTNALVCSGRFQHRSIGVPVKMNATVTYTGVNHKNVPLLWHQLKS